MFRGALIAGVLVGALALGLYTYGGSGGHANRYMAQNDVPTATPIKHLVVLFNENVSFDHYFATYPYAANPAGEPAFTPVAGTPSVNGLSGALLTANPNFMNSENGANAVNPFRLGRDQVATADQGHDYTAEQRAYHNGAIDLVPKYTGNGLAGGVGMIGTAGQVMGYFDGNTVTALWNYAQNFAMNDNAFTSTYGGSSPGALNLVAGQTNGMQIITASRGAYTAAQDSYYVNDGQGGLTIIGDVDPGYDICSDSADMAMMSGRNIGDLLNAENISWGGFMGGFNLATINSDASTGCKRSTVTPAIGRAVRDYIPHHNWFQYYPSTANPQHLRPSSIEAIGYSYQPDGKTPDPANHQYDSDDFFAAVKAGNYPSVSFIKAPAFQDGHAGYSDPLDEQAFTVKVINFLQQQPDWNSTAVVIAWDDSDGWYDHAYAKPTASSFDPDADQLNGAGKCGKGVPPLGVAGVPVNGRCGPGTRIPFLLISPWARVNYVDHKPLNVAAILRFIEDNWLEGKRIGAGSFDAKAGSIMGMFHFSGRGDNPALFLDPEQGTPIASVPAF